MPRRKPVTQKDIAERKQVFDSGSWDFKEALDCLESSNDLLRERHCKWLNVICKLYWTIKLGQQQETPARKAEALKKARRQYPRLQRARKQLEKARKLDEQGREQEAKQKAARAMRVLKQPWLPQFLEQEVARLPSYDPVDPRHSYAELEAQYRRQSRPGRHQTSALEDIVHRLQAAASDIDKCLTWYKGEACPPRLIAFIEAVLNAAEIPHPNRHDNPSRFRRLMRPVAPSEGMKPSERGE
jgi:hypothetical protein